MINSILLKYAFYIVNSTNFKKFVKSMCVICMYRGLDQKTKIYLMFVTELNLPKKIWSTWKRPVFGLVVSRLFSPWFSFGTRWSLESFCVADENWRILVYAKKLSKKKCAHLSAQKPENQIFKTKIKSWPRNVVCIIPIGSW